MEGAEGARGADAPKEGGRARREGRSGNVSDGIQQGLAVLVALKDVLDETIREARDRGGASTERVKEALRSARAQAQQAASGASERFNFVSRTDFEQLQERVAELGTRLKNLEHRAARPPDAGTSRTEGN